MTTTPTRAPRKPASRLCACGCGESLTGQKSQRYVDGTHRQRGHYDRALGTGLPHRRQESLVNRQARIIRELTAELERLKKGGSA